MSNKNCNRKKFTNKFRQDWNELNLYFKSLIIVGIILFLVVILVTIFTNTEQVAKNQIGGVFRTTLASVFGFLLSSNIRFNEKKKNIKIEEIKNELNKIELDLDIIQEDIKSNKEYELEQYYDNEDINLVQIAIALGISIICILVLSLILITDNFDNAPSISQIRDLMCTSIGFLIGGCKNK